MTSTFEFKLPDLGEGVHEGRILRLHVPEGGDITEDAPLMEVETDKAAVEIPSPQSGRITKWHVAEKELVFVGNVMVEIEPAQSRSSRAHPSEEQSEGEHRTPASPSVRRLARELGIDLSMVLGSGPRGRLTRADIQSAADARGNAIANGVAPTSSTTSSTASSTASSTPGSTTGRTDNARTRGANSRRHRGRREHRRVRRYRAKRSIASRKSIARVMSESWATIPHVTDCNDADITQLEQLRKDFADPSARDRRITTLSFVIRAVCRALMKHPVLNASVDWDTSKSCTTDT